MSLFNLIEFVKDLIARFGYLGIAFGTFLEGVFPPIPSEVIMGFAGFLVAEGKFNPIFVIMAAVIGNFISVSLVWFLGRKYGRGFILKYGKYVGVSKSEVEKGEQLFEKYGYKVVLITQVIPLARTLIAFPAGAMNTKYIKFITFNSIGATIWLSILLYLGYTFGENWQLIETILRPFEKVIAGIIVLIASYLGFKLIQQFRKHLNDNA